MFGLNILEGLERRILKTARGDYFPAVAFSQKRSPSAPAENTKSKVLGIFYPSRKLDDIHTFGVIGMQGCEKFLNRYAKHDIILSKGVVIWLKTIC